MHRTAASRRGVEARAHDRAKHHLLDPADPLFTVLGADADKRRQVDAFLRLLEPALDRLPDRTGPDGAVRPLRVVDLGCGNAYLTFAAHRWLTDRLGAGQVRTLGVDVRPDVVARSERLAGEARLDGLSFAVGTIADAEVTERPDVVLALHACDTATDEALARAVRWEAPVVLAAPCCHHDVQRRSPPDRAPPSPTARWPGTASCASASPTC
ncbi:hypothetical protein GCM10025868_16150 [Angustibacter aerolatus]|uniref:Methyltransferase domain-containing protein n=1 Tax=Angustibacter aerolatus TaxID=1162965 RepID=A0ABQ6JHQ3_9ACTN|nr:hypothetical protein GCM10025868_16150 [Angustibacter aerolatus]